MKRVVYLSAVILSLLLMLQGCGSGGSSKPSDVFPPDTNGSSGSNGGSTSGTSPTQVGEITLKADNATLTADGKKTSNAVITVTVLDPDGQPVTGATVSFSNETSATIGGTLSKSTGNTNSNGSDQVIYTAGTKSGAAAISATVGDLSRSTTINLVAGSPVAPSVSAAPETLNFGGNSQITAMVKDANGNPVAGSAVSFTIAIPDNASGGSVTASGTTNVNGLATATYTAGTNAGTDTITATTVNGVSGTTSVTVSALGQTVTTLSLAAASSNVTAGANNSTTLKAKVLDANGQGIPGVRVTFHTDLGNLTPLTRVTDGSGIASVSISSTTPGSAHLTATASGVTSNSSTVNFEGGQPAIISILPSSSTVFLGGSSTISVLVLDDNRIPVSGETLTFRFSQANTGGSLSALTAVTDASGKANITYTAGSTPGTDTIQVTTSNNKTATVDIEGKFDLASLGLTQIDPGALLPAGDSVALTLTAHNHNGAAVTGASLSAVATGSATFTGGATKTTDASGQATFTLTDATKENVVLRIADSGGNVSVEKTINFGPTLLFTESAVEAVSQTTLTAYLRDANNVGIPGVLIDFLPKYGDDDNLISPTSATTDQNGAVTLTASDPNSNGGTVDVTVQVVGTTINGNSKVTFQPSSAIYGVDAAATFSVVKSGTPTTVQATVTDLNTGFPTGGQTVTFTVNKPAATLSDGTNSGVQTLQETTDSNGQASVIVTDATDENVTVAAVSGQEADVHLYFGGSLQLSPSTSDSIADGKTTKTLKATVVDANHARINGVPVNFQVINGNALLSTSSGTADSQGLATVDVTNSKTEMATIAASTGNLDPVSAKINYQAGDAANVSLSSTPDNATSLSLFGQATITAMVTDALGNKVADNTPVTFNVTGGATGATVTSSVATVDGKATATLNAGNISGSLIVTATAGSASQSINFTVAPSDAGSVQVVSVEPKFVQHLGQSGQQTSVITFSVKDPAGNAVADGTPVTISLDPLQLGGGELISDGVGPYTASFTEKTVNGQVSATFRAGVVAGTADVTATVATPLSSDISTVALVTVLSGEPDSLHLFTSGSPLNVPGLLYDGNTAAFNITIGDRYGNPVPDGTQVSFMVEPGCGTIGNSTGFSTTTTKGAISEDATFGSTASFRGLPTDTQDHCEIVAYLPGDEGFEDVNGNGVFDSGTDVCTGDEGEPYIDANGSKDYDPGELYIDVNKNGQYDGPNNTCDTDTIIWAKVDYVMSGSIATFNISPGSFNIPLKGSQTFTVIVADQNGSPPVPGTKLSVTTSAGTLVNGGTDIIPDNYSPATPWVKTFQLLSDATGTSPKQATITVTLTFPNTTANDNNGPDLTGQISGTIDN